MNPTLYADYGCPFAHRVLALLHHAEISFDFVEVAHGEVAIPERNPLGALPLLTHGELVLAESAVINEYLADRYKVASALSPQVGRRAQQRQAMALVDRYLAPLLFTRPDVEQSDSLRRALPIVESALTSSDLIGLVEFHIAPLWRWVSRFRRDHPAVATVATRPTLHRRLEQLLLLPCIERTGPDDTELRAQVARAQSDGRLPALGL